MEVKPGNVLISLSRIALSLSRTKKSTRDKPLQPSARYAFAAVLQISAESSSSNGAGM